MTKLCTIFESGNRGQYENYIPVLLLNVPSKIYESILCKYMFAFFKSIISNKQHGFMPGRSTVTNLTLFTHITANVVNDAKLVDAIYTDISKAINRVHHDILLNKLLNSGLSNPLVQHVTSYLQNRNQVVVYNGSTSKTYIARSGVPQGSNLDPLLFLIFINDLSEEPL